MQSDRYLSLELGHVSLHMIIFACSCSEYPCAPRLFLSQMPCLIWEFSLDNEREREVWIPLVDWIWPIVVVCFLSLCYIMWIEIENETKILEFYVVFVIGVSWERFG
jgi:hypothetical protein